MASTDSSTSATSSDSNAAASGTDASSAYYADPNQYYYSGYDYSTGSYSGSTADASGYSYDPSSQYYYDPTYYAQYYASVTSTSAPVTIGATPAETVSQQSAYSPNAQNALYNTNTATTTTTTTGSEGSSKKPPITVSKTGYTGPASKNNPAGTSSSTTTATADGSAETEKKKKKKPIIRAAGGEVWEDPTLQEWDENDFRLFAGDLGNEVTDELLFKAFSKYPSLQRTRVVRDKRTGKSRGYGFLSFKDPNDFVKAWREMNGKHALSAVVGV